jgi:signal peptidase I
MLEAKNGQDGAGFAGGLRGIIRQWMKDLVEVLITLSVILVILRILLGAQMIVPLVVVTSGSMVHYPSDNTWMLWLNGRGVGNGTIAGMAMTGGFNVGDMILVGRPDVKLGDIVIYNRDLVYGGRGLEPIIHRVVGIVYVNGSGVAGFDGTLDCFSKEDFAKYVGYVDDCRKGKPNCEYPSVPAAASYRFYLTKGDANDYADQCIPGTMKISMPVNEAQIPAKALLRIPYVGWIKIALNTVIRILTLQF